MNYALCNRWIKLASVICVVQDWRLTKVLGDNWGNPLLLSKNVKSSIQIKRNEYFVGNGNKIKNIVS